MAEPWSLIGPASEERLPELLDLVDRWTEAHGLAPEAAAELRLLAEEACANVVMHGFRGCPTGELLLQLRLLDGVAEVLVEDDGPPFDPAMLRPPELHGDWRERQPGGLGWHLIRSLADSVDHQRVGGRNRLLLRKRVEGA